MDKIIKRLTEKIRTKKFSNIDESIVLERINEFLKKNPKLKITENERSSEFKSAVKYVKQELHRPYGAFQSESKNRNALLEELRKNPEDIKIYEKILATHKSTKERLNTYAALYPDLFRLIGKPESILDIGCGLNPFSIPWMHLEKLNYIASEFNEEDNRFIQQYFDIIKNEKDKSYELKTVKIDLLKQENIHKLNEIKSEVVFAWKLFDLIKPKLVEEIIKNISTDARYIIASFSTKTLGNRKMNFPRRSWFQKMLRRINKEYQTLEYENEIFYIISV